MKLWNFLSFGNKKPMSSAELESPEARAAAAWLETVNPLKNMTASRMQNLFDASRDGDTVHLQWLYNEIEKIDPTLLICQQRRRGALASLDWNIATRNPRRTRGFDKTLAQEQAATLELAFGEADGANFTEAVDHLAGAFFRGFAHVLPKWSEDGLSLKGFDTLDQWNFVRDISTGVWYWNPEADAYTDRSGCRPIPEGTLLSFVCPFHIDYPAMQIYLREAVGEKGWAKFVERFGIPPVILTMPNDIPADQVERWRVAAEKVAEGGSGAVPGGTGVNFCDGARGINPFKDFTQHQREQIVLMSTGGLLTSLAEAGSGTLAGGAHSETWSEIRRNDSAKLASVINRDIAGRILDRAFPGRPHLAYFAFDTEVVPSPSEVFEDAVKARNAGYLIDKADLEERTGYKLIRAEENPPTPGNFPPRPTLNKEEPAKKPEKERGVLEAFTDDCSPVADAIKELLKDPSKEAADALIKRLPELLPEDPAMAAIIAEAMAKEFGNIEKLANTNQQRGKTVEGTNSGSFAPEGGGQAGESPKAKAKREKHEWQVKASQQAAANMASVKAGKDSPDFMPGVTISGGKKFDHIAFYNNDFRHIKDHVQGDFGGGNFGYNHQAMLEGEKISQTITAGTWFAHHGDYVAVLGKDKAVILSPDGAGLKITSTYESIDKVNEIRTGGFQRVFNKEDADDGSHSTSAGV